MLGCGQAGVYVYVYGYVEVEDEGSSWEGTFGGIESRHGVYLLRSLSAKCGTRPGARRWATWFVLGRP